MRTFETALWALFIIATLFAITAGVSPPFVLASGGLLSMLYFYTNICIVNNIGFNNTFKLSAYRDISVKKRILSIALGFLYSLSVVAMIFEVLRWPGAHFMLCFSLFFVLVTLFLFIARKNKGNNSDFYLGLIKRNGFFLVVFVLFIVLSQLIFKERFSDN